MSEVQVELQYGKRGVLQAVLSALQEAGKDVDRLTPADLAPVDEFHIRGREATVELAARIGLQPGQKVVDAGCGIGGSARYLSSEYGVEVHGVDLTHEFIEAGTALVDLVGLTGAVHLQQGNALSMPFADASFDVAWTEHVQMNIDDKRAFYRDIARVLRPGGTFAFHDIMLGESEGLQFPLPWADSPAVSFLQKPQAIREHMEGAGLLVEVWEDRSAYSAEWFGRLVARLGESGPPPLGLHLLIGGSASAKFGNLMQALQDGVVVVVQGVARKGCPTSTT